MPPRRALFRLLLALASLAWGRTPGVAATPRLGSLEVAAGARRLFSSADDAVAPAGWIAMRPASGGPVEFWGPGLVLDADDLDSVLRELAAAGAPLARRFSTRTAVLRIADARRALDLAAALARDPRVRYAAPLRRRRGRLQFPFAPAPNDPYYRFQTHLESPLASNSLLPSGPDIDVREAWALTTGAGVRIAFADDGVRLDHPDLAPNLGQGGYNFILDGPGGSPAAAYQYHGTAVAGLAAARGGNGLGVAGAAPAATWVSWVIFDGFDNIGDDSQLAAMWMHGNAGAGAVSVQNHSWGNSDFAALEMSPVEDAAIDSAVGQGRGGLGVVLVRAAGNVRQRDYSGNSGVGDANLDAYAADPRQITVGAVRGDGRVASYSVRGACVLVAAPGGDPDAGFPSLITTDLPGADGLNGTFDPGHPDAWDYTLGTFGFSGTSAAAPVVSGIAALVLARNPALGWRDVQAILALSARQRDTGDPDVATNGAGMVVSHNTGFGVPDAGTAVRLAARWSNRPPAVSISWTNKAAVSLPDDGLRLVVVDADGVSALGSFPASGSDGAQPAPATPPAPWRDLALGPLTNPPTQGVVLMDRGVGGFAGLLKPALAAGAQLAVIVDNLPGDQRETLSGLDFVPLTAVLVGANTGRALRSVLRAHPGATVSARLVGGLWQFRPAESLSVEHARVRVAWSHPRLSDLRVTLTSPSGLTSVLLRAGGDTNAAPASWTFSSVHFRGEPSAGPWTVQIYDEAPGATGSVSEVALQLDGAPIVDTDADGLDDRWETAYFGTLAYGPRDDPDHDGWNNAAEQRIGSSPIVNDAPLAADVHIQSQGWIRVTWPGVAGVLYQAESATKLGGPWTPFKQAPGRFPETGIVAPPTDPSRYFRIATKP